MGCQCTKKNENSNVNLQEDTVKNAQLNNTTEDNSEFVNINLLIRKKIAK